MHLAHEQNGCVNPIFEAFGLPGDIALGSNSSGPHPSSINRPVYRPEWDTPSSRGYVARDTMINEPFSDKPFKIIFMGAGAAGIDFLHFAPAALKDLNIEIAVYEKNSDVGGTWYENRYPGCACDVPSISYSFPWKMNPSWTRFYSSSKEIWEYMRRIVDEEGMMKYIQLQTMVSGATWNEEKSKWIVKVKKLNPGNDAKPQEWEEECDLFINGGGFLK
jgi:hypothetical protein